MQDTHTADLLQPVVEALDRARAVLALASVVVILVVGGAQLERWLMKRKLSVIDGEKQAADGDRS